MKTIKNIFVILVSLFSICGFFLFEFKSLFNPAIEKILNHLVIIYFYVIFIFFVSFFDIVDDTDIRKDFEFNPKHNNPIYTLLYYILFLGQIIILFKFTFSSSMEEVWGKDFMSLSPSRKLLAIYSPSLLYVISCPFRRLKRIEKKLDGNSDE